MYNADVKQRWINVKEENTISSDNYYGNKMDNAEPYEKLFNKDLCNFTVSEILDMYKGMNFYSPNTIYITNKLYADYTDWCINEGLVADSQNHYLLITREMTIDCVNVSAMKSRVVSRETVIDWCNQAWNAADRFLILGLFEGIKGNRYVDFTDTKIQDVEGNTIHLASGRTLEFSDKLISYAYASHDENQWIYYGSEAVSPLAAGDEIMRQVARAVSNTDQNKWHRIFMRSKRLFDYLGILGVVSMNAIRISGAIDYINRNAKEEGVNAKTYIENHKEEIEYRYMKMYKFYETYKDFLV